jgi:hypothetical protein
MDKQQPGRVGGVASPQPRAYWTMPIVDRLVAGAAEANAGNDVEGQDGLS